jgi:four helix bundle protein
VSIPANIAEGSARRGDKEFSRFLYIACGSAGELEYFSIVIADLGVLRKGEAAKIEADAVEINRISVGLSQACQFNAS